MFVLVYASLTNNFKVKDLTSLVKKTVELDMYKSYKVHDCLNYNILQYMDDIIFNHTRSLEKLIERQNHFEESRIASRLQITSSKENFMV